MISSVMQGLGFQQGNGTTTGGPIPSFSFSAPQTTPFNSNTSRTTSTTPQFSTTSVPSQPSTSTSTTTTGANLPNANLTIHLHVQMNELDQLPQQLNRLRSMVNLTSSHQIGSQENIQIVTETPSSTNSAPISQQNLMNTIRNTVQNNPNSSLSSVVNEISTTLGIDDTNDNSIFDKFIKIAMDCMDMGDIFQLTT